MLYLDVLKIDRVLHMGIRMGNERGHERSPRAVRHRGQCPDDAEDVRKGVGHAEGDVLGPLVFIYGATHAVMLTPVHVDP
jgi:hypothetical protein